MHGHAFSPLDRNSLGMDAGWPWPPDAQVTFSTHGSFSPFTTQSLTCVQRRSCSQLLPICHPIWSSQQCREEIQDQRDVASRSHSPGRASCPSSSTEPKYAGRGLSPQSMRAQEVISSAGNTCGSLQVTCQTLSPLSLLAPFGESPMPSGPLPTLAATTYPEPTLP